VRCKHQSVIDVRQSRPPSAEPARSVMEHEVRISGPHTSAPARHQAASACSRCLIVRYLGRGGTRPDKTNGLGRRRTTGLSNCRIDAPGAPSATLDAFTTRFSHTSRCARLLFAMHGCIIFRASLEACRNALRLPGLQQSSKALKVSPSEPSSSSSSTKFLMWPK